MPKAKCESLKFGDAAWITASRRLWRSMSLSLRFVITGGLLMLAAMIVSGVLVSDMISREALKSRAAATALFVQSLVAPFAQELRTSGNLSQQSIAQLNRLYADETFGSRFPYLELWAPDGSIVYSNTPKLIGYRFSPPKGLGLALAGDVTSDYADLNAREHTIRGFGKRYLEIYSPIREQGSSQVVAVAEIHEDLLPLSEDMMQLRLSAWFVVALMTLIIMSGLFGIVHRGSRTIEQQSFDLKSRITEIEELLRLNRNLTERSQRASARVAEINEQFIRSVGADIHDGPAQLVSYSVLMIDAAHKARTSASRNVQLARAETALDEALRDLRAIARGLLLPDIAAQPFSHVLERVVRAHEVRTSTKVTLAMTDQVDPVSHAVKICAYRFIQEGLNNAFRHGGAVGQEVKSWMEGTTLRVSVSDEGGKAQKDDQALSEGGLGLHGLRERVESLGGTLTMQPRAECGSTIEMAIDLSGGLRIA
ncbi:MAG TPA: ATP-binding protein [Bosea sp. (in: a-proteobacteria)]|jgi:hypothetical protein|uniref:sensor histidine kinase n=1 Tax=Bosea sp. (in: a-proteobacteria) TaxID=1871050 RepID=UPI002E0DF3A4|nr:ATP-binding protein [Bosea sp. (in: a-proteobacteria)]